MRAGHKVGRADADRVAAALEDLPLAVTQAAAFLAETGYPAEKYLELLATVAGDPLKFADVTWLLRQRALARISTDHLQLHRLVQAVLRSRSGGATDTDEMERVALRLLRGAVPADPRNNPPAWPAWRQLLPHVRAVTDPGGDLDPAWEDVAWLLDHAALYLDTAEEPRLARPLSTGPWSCAAGCWAMTTATP